MAQRANFLKKQRHITLHYSSRNGRKNIVPSLEAKATDENPVLTPKQWLERFRQFCKREHQINITSLLNLRLRNADIKIYDSNHRQKITGHDNEKKSLESKKTIELAQ